MRANRRLVVSLVATALVLGTGISAAPAGAKTPKITVTPNKNLKPGQTVHVTGTGFSPRSEILGAECPRGATDPFGCDLGNSFGTTSDAHGAFPSTVVVHRTLLGENGFTDCGLKGCALLFSDTDSFGGATADIAFDPNAPLPKTSLTVTPSTKLKNLQSLRVVGKGFDLDGGQTDVIEVVECVVKAFACSLGTFVAEPENGTFSKRFPVTRMLTDRDGRRIDCAKKPGTCELLAIDGLDVDYHAGAPLAFDPKLPPPPPATMTVKPDTKLPFYARVALSGKHWAPNDFVFVLECAGETFADCAPVGIAQTDAHGVLNGAPMLQREIPNLFDPGAPTDCAAPHTKCTVMAQGTDGSTVTVAVAFDPKAPIPPPPTATATPAPPYTDRQVVRITGKHFAPDASISVTQCFSASGSAGCAFFLGDRPHMTDAAGGLSIRQRVYRSLDSSDPSIDCKRADVTCWLQVSSEGGASVDVPISFKAGGGAVASAAPLERTARGPQLRWFRAATSPAVVARAAVHRIVAGVPRR